MKVIINNVVYDGEKDNIVLAWEDDSDRYTHLSNLNNMADSEGPRAYAIVPDATKRSQPVIDIIKQALVLCGYLETTTIKVRVTEEAVKYMFPEVFVAALKGYVPAGFEYVSHGEVCETSAGWFEVEITVKKAQE